MSRFQERLSDYKSAVDRLEEALKEPESEIVIDGVLHRFEFTFELAWKTIKDALEYLGLVDKTGSPRENIQLGFRHGIRPDRPLRSRARRGTSGAGPRRCPHGQSGRGCTAEW